MAEKPRIARRLAWAAGGSLLLIVVVVAAMWFSGRTVWTDGQSTRVPGRDARLREVLWAAARPLEPELISAEQQYEPSLSPDGTELYFVRGKPGRGAHIYVSHRRDNAWTLPVRVDAVTGPTDDLGPRVTADGRFLLFASDRPGGLGGFDLWAAPRQQGGWGAPFNLGPAVNTEFNELNPDPTPDGRRLIFSTNRKAAGREQKQAWRGTIRETGSADYDLWIATLDHDTAAATTQPTATQPTTAPTTRPAAPAPAFSAAAEIPGVNTDFSEGASCMSPAGDFLYFASNRPGGLGKFDIYRCRVRDGGQFGPVENVGPPINTPENEADPSMAMAGFRIVFSSDRNSAAGVYALYTSDSREVFALREGRPLPRLGWSVWSLLLSALLLIPLILALRGLEGRHLNTLQRCLVLSLLLHAALTCVFSFVLVSRDVARGLRRGSGGEIALNLSLPKDVEIGLAVRGQLSSPSDLPITAVDPVPVARETTEPTPTLGPTPVRIDAPANAAPVTTLPPPPITVAAKSHAPTDLPRVAPANPVANGSAAPLLPDLGPRDVADRLAQATPEPSATDVQPRPVSPTVVAAPRDARPLRGVDTAVPSATPSAAARISIEPPPVATRQSPPPSGDATAVAPTATTSRPPADLPIANLPSQDATVARLKAEAPPAPTPSDAPRPATRPLAFVANGPGGAPLEIAPSAAPVRPTTAPAGIPLASAASTRPAPSEFPAPPANVQPARTAETAPAVALTPPNVTGPLPINAKIDTANTPAEPPRTAEVSLPLDRQASAISTSPQPPLLSTSLQLTAAIPPQSATALALPTLSPQAPRPLDVTGGADVVAPLATRSAAPLELPSTAPVLPPSLAKVSVPASEQQLPNLNPADAKLATARATAPDAPPTPAPISTGQPPPPNSRDQTTSLASPPPFPRGTIPLLPPPPSPAAAVAVAAVPLDPPASLVAPPPSQFPRSPEQRQARVEKLGGNAQSESAVDRGLAYLAANQEADGRWTLVLDDDARTTGRRPRSYHDMANTGLAVLAFLARDHAPGKPGPYPKAVAMALDYLIDQQDDDGDLRGPPHLRGEGSRRGDMYDHAIATLALAEAALMTGGDRRYAEAALRGARFIVAAQDPRSGGWRYVPGEYGDSSVFGWQLMALHAAEQLGFKTPDRTRQLARGYVRLASQGPRRMLAGYQPGRPATRAMTAEILYGRMLLGERLDPDDIEEATDFLTGQAPDPREPSLYYWYYASLCMLQFQSPDWKRWNARTRDGLIELQTRGGPADGSWDADPRYAERGGRIYMTAIAVLTLEVYYRYLPLPNPTAAPK